MKKTLTTPDNNTLDQTHGLDRGICTKALLDPSKYDNYQLWAYIDTPYLQRIFLMAAEEVSNWQTIVDNNSNAITFPDTDQFLEKLFARAPSESAKHKFFNILTYCAIDSSYVGGEKEKIRTYYKNSKPTFLPSSVYKLIPSPSEFYGYSPMRWDLLAGYIGVLGLGAVVLALCILTGGALTGVALAGAVVFAAGMLTSAGIFAANNLLPSREFKEPKNNSMQSKDLEVDAEGWEVVPTEMLALG